MAPPGISRALSYEKLIPRSQDSCVETPQHSDPTTDRAMVIVNMHADAPLNVIVILIIITS